MWDHDHGSEGPGFVGGVRLYPGEVPRTMISTLGSHDEVFRSNPNLS